MRMSVTRGLPWSAPLCEGYAPASRRPLRAGDTMRRAMDRPFPPASRRMLGEEVLAVLSLSLLASAVFAIIDLLSQPLRGVIVSTYPNVGVATQLASIAFGLATVWLVFHL